MKTQELKMPRWTRNIMLLGSFYYLICGITAIFTPELWLFVAGVRLQDYELPLTVVGGLMCAIGVGKVLSIFALASQWVFIVVLVAANLFDLLLILYEIYSGRLPVANGALFVLVDLFWVIAFAKILGAQQILQDKIEAENFPDLNEALSIKPSGAAKSLLELSNDAKLIIFHVRHGGCTFCREHLALLANEQKNWTDDYKLIIVGMTPIEDLKNLAEAAGLKNYQLISDPERKLYQAFGIEKGNFQQLLGPKVIWHTIINFSLFKYGIGLPAGNVRQLPGVVIVSNGKILAKKVSETANEYCEIGSML